MMMETKKRKLNNEGASLLEFIVVFAIMVVVIGVVVTGFTIVTNSYARKAASGFIDMLSTARTKAMSVAAEEWNMELEYIADNGNFICRVNKVTQETLPDGNVQSTSEVVQEEIFNGDLQIKFINVTGTNETPVTLNSTANKLKISFSGGQGSVSNVYLGDVPFSNCIEQLGDLARITITSGSYEKNIELYYTTGKYEALD
ncbi:MAG: hypothetical protein K2M73_06875 [Lachnospiraceae bacterium]|nr:hypothetical protein [Lachnospiraceae bacterium]